MWISLETSNRLKQASLSVRSEEQTTCCYAMQDKAWVTDPDEDDWEIYTVLQDMETFSCSADCT